MHPRMTRTLAIFAAILTATSPPAFAEEMWELPPILYSKTQTTDPIAQLSSAIERGETHLPDGSENDVLRFLLDLLKIPESSQILVYSKTSAQNYYISPRTPRALYYNENAYVGHVLGGGFELIIHDPQVGVAFYFIERNAGKYHFQRDTSSCLNCHATGRTEGVPGLTVRSVPTDDHGNLLLTLGSTRTDYRIPIEKRWAGYYVTGSSSLPHLGNRTFDLHTGIPEIAASARLPNLKDRIDTSRYLRDTSDIIALMVLEHQCLVHNLLTRVSMDYRRAKWREAALGENTNPTAAVDTVLPRIRELTDAMLFKGEAPMGDTGVDGSEEFQRVFAERFPKSKDGDSLADFHLGNRIFKNRCSYMIHSQAFISLPVPVKAALFQELRNRLATGKDCDWIPESERLRILDILAGTVPGFNEVKNGK